MYKFMTANTALNMTQNALVSLALCEGFLMFERKPKPQDPIDALKGLAVRPGLSNKQWLNLLLLHMQKASINSFTLKKSKGIPPLPPTLEEDLHEGELDFDKIINCLKTRDQRQLFLPFNDN
jgi:hypothetical protein